jgi:hypothetical protein
MSLFLVIQAAQALPRVQERANEADCIPKLTRLIAFSPLAQVGLP